jgi:hypothetical protein
MFENARQTLLQYMDQARSSATTLRRAAADRWERVSPDDRLRLRNYGVAVASVTAATLLTLTSGARGAGPLILADIAIAAAAWFGGLSTGAVAALMAVLVTRLTAGPLTGESVGPWLTLVLTLKGLIVAAGAAALSNLVRADRDRVSDLEARIERMAVEARNRQAEVARMEISSEEARARLQQDAEEARRQLRSLQSVTDPALNTLQGTDLVTSLLDRVRTAIGADGVALFSVEGARIFSATGGVPPKEDDAPHQVELGEYRTGRTAMIHNDPVRVADASLCHWPADVTSLIAVPIVHSGRLQLVLEVANQRARRSTEWELALIQVVAERAAGHLHQLPLGSGAAA